MKKKILFDLTVFQTGDKDRGIGRYSQNFLDNFLKIAKILRYIS